MQRDVVLQINMLLFIATQLTFLNQIYKKVVSLKCHQHVLALDLLQIQERQALLHAMTGSGKADRL